MKIDWILLALVLAPVLVAATGAGTAAAAGMSAGLLLTRWALNVVATVRPPAGPTLRLQTIAASHYVEKVRWCLDRLEVPYVEEPAVGLLGIFFTGRSVPRLLVRTGRVWTSIGNSPEILRFLWGSYGHQDPERAAFLQPTTENLALEAELDDYGRLLQIWIYHHLLDHPQLTLRIWGQRDPELPAWQRSLVRLLYPLLRLFLRNVLGIRRETGPWVRGQIEAVLDGYESRLTATPGSVTGGDELSFVDITLASLSGPWLNPRGYSGGRADACLASREELPEPMRADVLRWVARYPRVCAHIEGLYRDHR